MDTSKLEASRIGHACQTHVSDTILLFSMYFLEFVVYWRVVSHCALVVVSVTVQHSIYVNHYSTKIIDSIKKARGTRFFNALKPADQGFRWNFLHDPKRPYHWIQWCPPVRFLLVFYYNWWLLRNSIQHVLWYKCEFIIAFQIPLPIKKIILWKESKQLK